jgi:hypothetical protein
MSEYESIHGTRVKYLTSDPTLDSTTEGQVWYNSTSGTNKTLVHIKAFSVLDWALHNLKQLNIVVMLGLTVVVLILEDLF